MSSPLLLGRERVRILGEGRGDRRDGGNWQESQAGEGLRIIEERWKQMSCNYLCYVARMEDQDQEDGVGGGRKRRSSSVSLSPLSKWV